MASSSTSQPLSFPLYLCSLILFLMSLLALCPHLSAYLALLSPSASFLPSPLFLHFFPFPRFTSPFRDSAHGHLWRPLGSWHTVYDLLNRLSLGTLHLQALSAYTSTWKHCCCFCFQLSINIATVHLADAVGWFGLKNLLCVCRDEWFLPPSVNKPG